MNLTSGQAYYEINENVRMTPLTDLLKVHSQLHQNKTNQMFKKHFLMNKTNYFIYMLQTMRQCNIMEQGKICSYKCQPGL